MKESLRFLIAIVFALAVPIACAGANGDPAPAPQEAGVATIPGCLDAGATE